MKKILLLTIIGVLGCSTVKADEGMWLLSLIGKNYEQMKSQGFKLTAEDIYNVNKSCLKDAVVGLGKANSPFWHFCTGELVSGDGIFTTNHHCGFGMIQSHSSVEHDYLRDGFWAYKLADELPNEGITAQILVKIEDVTDKVKQHLNDEMSEGRRNFVADSIGRIIADEVENITENDVQVIDMFNGNQFLLFEYKTYKDIRLVGAPPQSMGKFGGDTDNWEWPRHTADFSMFRIYTDKNGNPAEYSADNIPLRPKYFFPINIKGVKDGDFAMVMGFPGTTDRFLTSYGLDETMNIQNRLVYNIRSVKINTLREKMAESQKTRIQYASKYASCSNYWKYTLQQNKALRRLNTRLNKEKIEKEYQNWANQQADKKYSSVLKEIKEGFEARKDLRSAKVYISQGIFSGPDMIMFAYQVYNSLEQIQKMTDDTKRKQVIERLQNGSIKLFYKDFNPEVEQLLIANLFDYTYKNMDSKYYPSFFTDVLGKKYKGNAKKYASMLMKKSIFASQDKLIKALNKGNMNAIANDPAVEAARSAIEQYRNISKQTAQSDEAIERGNRLFVKGLLAINKDKLIAPDANSTIRITYGNIGGYEPRDGVEYSFYTTLDGVMQKEDPTSTEFIVPERLKELYRAKDFGPYADKDGNLPTCFISNNDITGGNSGSPVLDAEGNLIGLAFDGNSEAMSGDIDFEENLQRCINLDVRYMLFIIDKFAGATNLLKEMKIVK
ncbi:MAG: serine protease [Bacteroidales bacterium]|nr:MAG: serine protease [Bacteroidales bacterium]